MMFRMISLSQAEEAFHLLSELLVVLDSQRERNWSSGIKGAIAELLDAGGKIDPAGFENARSIYNTMTKDGRGFSEYYIHKDDFDERINANQKLDDLKGKIWRVFNPV